MPNYHNKSKKIYMLSPASLPKNRHIILKCCDFLKNAGYAPVVSQNLENMAGDSAARLTDLKTALTDDKIDILWSVKGGYGSTQLLPLDIEIPKTKIIIGFSDITALQLYFIAHGGYAIHGEMLGRIVNKGCGQSEGVRILLDIVNGSIKSYNIKGLTPLNKLAKQAGDISGITIGGNLSLIQSSIGTKWQAPVQGRIIFLEEYDEAPYSIDRMLTHLDQACDLDKASAIIFGEFIKCNSQKQGYSLTQVLNKWVHNLKVPIYYSSSFGHGENNLPIIQNTTAKIVHTDDNECLLQVTVPF